MCKWNKNKIQIQMVFGWSGRPGQSWRLQQFPIQLIQKEERSSVW